MKLKKGFITHETDGEQILIATGEAHFSGLVRSNKTAAFIVNCLEKECTREQIVEAMEEKYDAAREILERDVDKIIEQLKSIGAIDE